MKLFETKDESKCCTSCEHNIRTWNKGDCHCNCGIDGHYIGYVEGFTFRCRRWKEEKKWQE